MILSHKHSDFANRPIRNMVAIGAVTPTSFRLWIRSRRPGAVSIRWFPEGQREMQEITVAIAEDNASDNTIGVTIGDRHAPLLPLTRYGYRVTFPGDGASVEAGNIETAPADAADTPDRYSFALLSCNQPFKSDGRIDKQADQMLTAARRCFKAHNTKFVLMIGDQMYADMPANLSLFNPDYFKRIAPPGRDAIQACTVDEIRRLYQRRYRHFWNLPGWFDIHRELPSYMMWDDHDIVDNWGSAPSHQEPGWRRVFEGARLAYMDYQASLVHHLMPDPPRAFDYGFRYGTAAVYMLDIRSNRRTGKNGRIYSSEQFRRVRRFLADHADADALFLVLTVPILQLPRHIASLAAKISPEQEDFSDRWSSRAHVYDRDRLMKILHRHARLHPRQRIALLSGDIHIGCAHHIAFPQVNIYQLLSSGVTHGSGPLVGWGSKMLILSNRKFKTLDHSLNAKIKRLQQDGAAKNPYTGLNVGIVEMSKSANDDAPGIRFLLYGQQSGRPVCVYRSAMLDHGLV